MFVDRLLSPTACRDDFIAGQVPIVHSWAGVHFEATWEVAPEQVKITLCTPGLQKTLSFGADGVVRCDWQWETPAEIASVGGWFSTELSLSSPFDIDAPGAERWEYAIETVAKSEKGFDRTVQGTALVFRWPLTAHRASLTARRSSASARAS